MGTTTKVTCKCRPGFAWHDKGEVGWCLHADFASFYEELKDRGITDFDTQWHLMVEKFGHNLDWDWQKVPQEFVEARLTHDWPTKMEGDQLAVFDAVAGLWRDPAVAAKAYVARLKSRAVFGHHLVADQMNREGL